MKYRREIDGLRALALIPVILFHANIPLFSGGYVGVDVFFVISGYLITSIILSELESNQFSIANFYERRARRILPALFLVLFLSLVFAWFFFLPRDMKSFSKSLAAVPLFISNLVFWRNSGYFDATAEYQPLIHTWSLAVEEQFYIIFPVFIMLVWRLAKFQIFLILATVGIMSLALAQWTVSSMPVAAFYLLPTRGWELLAGAMIAFLPYRSQSNFSRVANELLGALGIGLILFAVFFFDKQTPFPGVFALIPTMGAALILIFTSSKTLAGKILSGKVPVAIGLVSYSAYLWHQPLFVFARIDRSSTPSPATMLILAALALVLGYLSWKFVEKPFRNRNQWSRKFIFQFSVSSSIVFVLIGTTGIKTEGFRERMQFPPNAKWMSMGEKLEIEGDICEPTPIPDYQGLSICYFGNRSSKRTIVLYGDSHAQAVSKALHQRMEKMNFRVAKAALDCGVIPDISQEPVPNPKQVYESCNQKFNELKRFIKDNNADVLTVSRWTFQFFPMRGFVETLPFDNGVGGVEKDLPHRVNVAISQDGSTSVDAVEKKAATLKLIRELARVSRTLYINYPIPEIGWDIFNVNLKHFNDHRSLLQHLSYPYEHYLSRNRFILDLFEKEAINIPNLVFLRSDQVFCERIKPGYCVAQDGGVPFYYDDDHLSDAGATLLTEEFAKNLK